MSGFLDKELETLLLLVHKGVEEFPQIEASEDCKWRAIIADSTLPAVNEK